MARYSTAYKRLFIRISKVPWTLLDTLSGGKTLENILLDMAIS